MDPPDADHPLPTAGPFAKAVLWNWYELAFTEVIKDPPSVPPNLDDIFSAMKFSSTLHDLIVQAAGEATARYTRTALSATLERLPGKRAQARMTDNFDEAETTLFFGYLDREGDTDNSSSGARAPDTGGANRLPRTLPRRSDAGPPTPTAGTRKHADGISNWLIDNVVTRVQTLTRTTTGQIMTQAERAIFRVPPRWKEGLSTVFVAWARHFQPLDQQLPTEIRHELMLMRSAAFRAFDMAKPAVFWDQRLQQVNPNSRKAMQAYFEPLIMRSLLTLPPLVRDEAGWKRIQEQLEAVAMDCHETTRQALRSGLIDRLDQPRGMALVIHGSSGTSNRALVDKLCRALDSPVAEARDLNELFSKKFSGKLCHLAMESGRNDIVVRVDQTTLVREADPVAWQLVELLKAGQFKTTFGLVPDDPVKQLFYGRWVPCKELTEPVPVKLRLTLLLTASQDVSQHEAIGAAVGPGESPATLIRSVPVIIGPEQFANAVMSPAAEVCAAAESKAKLDIRNQVARGLLTPDQADANWPDIWARIEAVRQGFMDSLPLVQDASEPAGCNPDVLRDVLNDLYQRIDARIGDPGDGELAPSQDQESILRSIMRQVEMSK